MAGSSVEKISIDHLICVANGCMNKSGFNQDYLHPSYPNDILQNILLGKRIFNGKNLTKTHNGFNQKIKNNYYDIVYKVDEKQIFFKDKKNKIIFKIKDMENE